MSVYKIFENGKEINRIVADEDFVVPYCERNGYTYELEVPPEPPEPQPEPPTTEERLAAVESAMLALMMGGNELV